MTFKQTAIERAFEIAKSGSVGSVSTIRSQLKAEGYDPNAFQGKTVSAQLRAVIQKARKERSSATEVRNEC